MWEADVEAEEDIDTDIQNNIATTNTNTIINSYSVYNNNTINSKNVKYNAYTKVLDCSFSSQTT